MSEEKQKDEHRVTFKGSIAGQIMAIDGTWGRLCTLKEVSDTLATLVIEGSVEGLNLKEFFLLRSSTGPPIVVANSLDERSVSFLRQRGKQKKSKPDDPCLRPPHCGNARSRLPCSALDYALLVFWLARVGDMAE